MPEAQLIINCTFIILMQPGWSHNTSPQNIIILSYITNHTCCHLKLEVPLSWFSIGPHSLHPPQKSYPNPPPPIISDSPSCFPCQDGQITPNKTTVCTFRFFSDSSTDCSVSLYPKNRGWTLETMKISSLDMPLSCRAKPTCSSLYAWAESIILKIYKYNKKIIIIIIQ